METNIMWKHYLLEERVTRAQTYEFVSCCFFWRGGLNVAIFFFFCNLKDFTIMKMAYHYCGFIHKSHNLKKNIQPCSLGSTC